ncbi:unnamed protein product [Calypogeia fissa]
MGAEEEGIVSEEQHRMRGESSAGGIYQLDPMKTDRSAEDLDSEVIGDGSEKLEILSLPLKDGDHSFDSTFAGLKKKKKKKPVDGALEEENLDTTAVTNREELDGGDENEKAEGIVLDAGFSWEGSDRDYNYDELLGRVFNILRENNPELAGEKRRTIMRPPQVLREGTKKTVFVNFMDLCKTMHRQPEHVMAFLLAELGTSGSLDGQQRLVVKGRFAPKNFEGILRRYVNEYVICNGCKSPDTILIKENRLFFLRCEHCRSSRSVAPIQAGFVARVGRRKATT